MTDKEIDIINRFTNRLPDQYKDHWAEILEIIQVDYISQLELDILNYHFKLIDQVRLWKILQLWISEGKFTSKQSVINFADNAINKITCQLLKSQ